MYTLTCIVRDPLASTEQAIRHCVDEMVPLSLSQMQTLQGELQTAINSLQAAGSPAPAVL